MRLLRSAIASCATAGSCSVGISARACGTSREPLIGTSTWRRCDECTPKACATDWPRDVLVDAETVERRLRHIGEHVLLLRDIAARGHHSFMTDSLIRTAAERALQVAIQAALDITNHIIAEDSDQT